MKNDFTRRQFLKRSAGIAGAATIAPKLLTDPNPIPAMSYVPPSDTVRFGIIGIGMQGSGLLHDSLTLPGVQCGGAADLYDGRHTLAKELTGNKDLFVTRKYQELLDRKDIDCIVAAVPDHWHKRVVVDATSAGKDIYIEKPMSHTGAEGVAMVAAQQKSGRIVQVGSQRVSSVICAKAKEMIAAGAIGKLTLVEGSLGRNDPTGAWEYPPPPDLSLRNFDWDTWQSGATTRPWDPDMSPKWFARWRCWKEYGTAAAGAPVYLRLNLGCETPEVYRFQGSHGILEVTEFTINHYPQSGEDSGPSYYTSGYPQALREAYLKQWHKDHDAAPGQEPLSQAYSWRGDSWDDERPHLWTYFSSVKSRKPLTEDAVFGH